MRLSYKIMIDVGLALVVLGYVLYGRHLVASALPMVPDRSLSLTLYAVGGLLAALGCYVSVKPPHKRSWKIASALVFVLLFYVGFLVTDEQAKRSSKASADAEAARRKDVEDRVQYDKDVQELRGKVMGIEAAITAVAKGSPNPSWSALLARLPQVRAQTVDPELEVLRDAEAITTSLRGWHEAAIADRRQREDRTRLENRERGLDDHVAAERVNWMYGLWWKGTLRDYQQTYAPELMRLRREMLGVAPEAGTDRDFDWQNPGSSGMIIALYFSLRQTLAGFRIHLRREGKLKDAPTEDETTWLLQHPNTGGTH